MLRLRASITMPNHVVVLINECERTDIIPQSPRDHCSGESNHTGPYQLPMAFWHRLRAVINEMSNGGAGH